MSPAVLIAMLLSAGPTLPSARSDYAAARTALQAAQSQVSEEQSQLDALDSQIAADKAKQPGQPLFVPGALEHELAQSQSLSDELARSRAEQASLASRLESSRAALYQALSDEIAAREAQGPHDPASLDELAKLQAERAQVAPSSQVAVVAPKFTKPTDDPALLRERADALRDQADKLGKQQLALNARIQAARDQAELDAQLRQLNGDDSLFDESDRRIRVSHTNSSSLSTPTSAVGTTGGATGGGGDRSTPSEPVGGFSDAPATNQAGGSMMGGGAEVPSPQAQPEATQVISTTQTGQLVRPDQLGRAGAAALDDDASLPELLRAQQQLEQQRKALEAQAKALDAQAAASGATGSR